MVKKFKIEKLNSSTFKIPYKEEEVEIGDKTKGYFKPHVKFFKWNRECSLSIELQTTKRIIPIEENGKLKWKDTKKEVHFYPLEAKEQMEDGGFEIEVLLKEKPISNKVVFNIETQSLDFFYQSALNKEYPQSKNCSPTKCDTNKDGKIDTFRPENIVGSYAVYHSTKKSKFGNIFRPKIIDKNGDWIWGEMNIDKKKGTLTITIDKNWLNNAIYPIIVDPTLGYTTKGSTGASDWKLAGGKFTASENGTIISISTAIWNWGGSAIDVNFGLYEDNAGAVGNFIASGIKISVASSFNGWKTIPVSASIVNGNTYWIIAQKDDTTNMLFWNDSGSSTRYWDTSHIFDNWGTPVGGTYTSNLNQSIYATYTVSGGTPVDVTKALAYEVIASIEITKTLEYEVITDIDITKTLEYEIVSEQEITKGLQYQVVLDVPNVTTQAVDTIEKTTAMGHGTIVS